MMSTLQQIRSGLEKAWEGLREGWQEFYHHTAQALTRFTPRQSDHPLETKEEQLLYQSCRWGMLAAEVLENDSEIIVKLEAPGMKAEDFNISIQEGVLVIRGEKRVQREGKQGHYHFMECAYGQFERALPLPTQVEEGKTEAQYHKGILRITLPKAPGSMKRRIPVQGA